MPRIASINPASLATPIGFAHGVASSGGRLLWLAGQNGMDDQGRIVAPGDIVAQTDLALANILAVVAAAAVTGTIIFLPSRSTTFGRSLVPSMVGIDGP